jgi:hypothetical protein
MRTISVFFGLIGQTRILSCIGLALLSLFIGGHARGGVVSIDLTGFTGINGGLVAGGSSSISPFPPGSTTRLDVFNGFNFGLGAIYGVSLQNGPGDSGIAVTGASGASPIAFGAGTIIDGSAGGGSYSNTLDSSFQGLFGAISPAFGPNSFLGFKDSLGRYGYIEVTWDGVDKFQLISAAYESTPGVAIQTPSGGAVPEPTSMAIFGLGALGFAYRARRKSKAQA